MTVTTVILIKETAMQTVAIDEYYLKPLAKEGIPENSVSTMPLLYDTATKLTTKLAKAYLGKLIASIPATVTTLIIADSAYFKLIAKAPRVKNLYGATTPGMYTGYEKFTCVYVPSHKSLFKQPENQQLITLGLKAVAGTGAAVQIHSAEFGLEYGSDRELLDSLYKHPVLAVDIETTGLTLEDKIISISFCWTKHDGIAIDLMINGFYYLKNFLEQYKGKKVYHGGLFDAKLLIRHLWMKHSTDWEGMIEGLQYFRDFDDTQLMAFIAKNATTDVPLNLKELALEYVGNYAIEITDVSKYTIEQILQYNLIDGLATFYLYEKFQAELTSRPYLEILQPSIYPILKMMLVGLPMDSDRVKEVHQALSAKEKVLNEQIQENTCVILFNKILRQKTCDEANAKLKVKVHPLSHFNDIQFNPASPIQRAHLLHEILSLPILDTTKSGAAKTGRKILAYLANHTTNQNVLELLQFMQDLSEASKCNGTFLKAFMKEENFLHGSLKLGATQSGRLASESPNLQNLPAHGPMGKLVKSCIVAKPGWLFASADFSALEEKIGAILTNDPNRIKVYTDGFNGHSMRAQKYFADQMPDIDPNDVASVNSIEQKYPELRTKSKPPTFALQYDGTWHTLHKRAGFPKDQAKIIEKAYHELYVVSDRWSDNNKKFMEKHGYIECAFGLKLRTPIIAQCVLGARSTPYEAEAEGRSANNAVTQSWGMLLNRAMIATDRRIEAAGYGTSILPINMIHDAGYFMVLNTPEHIKFLNDVLIEEMSWNDDDKIRSTDVLMSASLEIGVSWNKLTELKNNATIEEIHELTSTFAGSV